MSIIGTKIQCMIDCDPYTAREIYTAMFDAGIFSPDWFKISWADQEIIVRNFVN